MPQIKICPHCQQHNSPAAADCVGCASPLDMIDPVELAPPTMATRDSAGSGPAAAIADGMVGAICPHTDCGASNLHDADTCLYCGRPLSLQLDAPLIQLPAALAARYRVCEQFPACGAEADVFLADDLEAARRVVLKLYRKGVRPKSEVLERVAQAAAAEVIALYDHGVSGGTSYEVLEHARHGSLRTLIEQGVAPEQSTRIVAELVSAIAHLHELKIIHRDIKPENILVRELAPLDLAFTDFGISSLLEFTQRLTGAHRTLRYSAPETASGLLTPKADWWSLGMVLIEVASGRHPFDGLPDPVIMNLLFTKPVDLSAVADPHWRTLCRGLLLRDPERRWGAPEVRRWLAGEDVSIDDRETPVGGAVLALTVGAHACRDARQLAQALAQGWAAGSALPAADQLVGWLHAELGDEMLAADVAGIQRDASLTADEQILKTLYRLAPDLPPLYRNLPLTGPDLIAAAQRALQDPARGGKLFDLVMSGDVLRHFPGNRLLQQIRQQWAAALAELGLAWESAIAGGAPAEARPEGDARPALFVASFSRRAAAGLAADARPPGAEALQALPWCAPFAEPAALSPARLLVWRALEPFARSQLQRLQQQHAAAERAKREEATRLSQLQKLQARLSIWGDGANGQLAADHRQLTERIKLALAASAIDEQELATLLQHEQELLAMRTRARRECCERWTRTLGSAVVHIKKSHIAGADQELQKLVNEMRRDDDPEIREILRHVERNREPVARVARREGLTANVLMLCMLVVLARVYLWIAESLFGWHGGGGWWIDGIKYGVWLALPLFLVVSNWLVQTDGPASALAEAQTRLEDYLRRMAA